MPIINMQNDNYPSSAMRLGLFALRHSKSKKQYHSKQELLAHLAKLRTKKSLLAPKIINNKYQVTESNSNGMQVYNIRQKDSNPTEYIFYIHGGGYVKSLLPTHWKIVDRTLKQFNVDIIMPAYPVAPINQVAEIQTKLFAEYIKLADNVGAKHITILGDSAGGGLAIALAQWLVANKHPQPYQIILFSPYLDGSLSNPAIHDIENKDPVLSLSKIKAWTELYAGGIPVNDPQISPINGNLTGLARITIFIGTNDILYPDAKKFAELVERQEGNISLYTFPEAFHIFMALDCPETNDVFQMICI